MKKILNIFNYIYEGIKILAMLVSILLVYSLIPGGIGIIIYSANQIYNDFKNEGLEKKEIFITECMNDGKKKYECQSIYRE